MDPAARHARLKKWGRRLAITGAVGAFVLGILGFFVIPPIARGIAEKEAGKALGRRVTIERIRLNPFALSLAIEGLQIYEADGKAPFFGWKRLYVNAQLSSAFRRAPVIKEVSLEGLRLHVARLKDTPAGFADIENAYNFSDILTHLNSGPPKPPPPPEPADAAPPRFSLNNLRLVDGAIFFDDKPAGGHHEITELSIGVPFVSTLPVYLDSFVQPGLSVRVDGTPFSVAGRTKPFVDSLETVLELRLSALDLTKYVPFVPLALPFSVDSAKLSLALDLAFVRPRADAPRLSVKGDVSLDALAVRQKRGGELVPLATLNKLAIAIGESDVTGQKFAIDRVLLSGLDLHVRRARNGSLNLEHLAPGKPEAAPVPKTAPKAEAKPAPKATADAGPQFKVGAFVLEKTAVHFTDETVSPAFSTDVRDFEIEVRGLSNAAGATATTRVALTAVPGGTIKEAGTLALTPLVAKGKVEIDGVEPGRFSSYYKDAILFDVTKGRVHLGTGFDVQQARNDTSVKLHDAYVELADVTLRKRGARDDFFKLGTLAVRGAKVDLGAQRVSVAEISTKDARIRALRDAAGVVDLTALTPPAPATTAPAAAPPKAPAAAPSSPAWAVTVDRFELDKWGVRFEDRAVTPTAVLTVDPIALHATNISTAKGERMGLDLRLGLNKAGRLQVTGSAALDPVAANLRFDLRTLELLPLQPYFADQVSLMVTGGTVSVKGRAAVKVPAGGEPQLDVNTDIDVADLATVDRAKKEPLLAWKSFHVGALAVQSPPMAISIGDVSLTDFQSRLVMFPDAHFNLQDAFAPPGAKPEPKPVAKQEAKPASKPTPPEAPAPVVKIAHVTLQGGNVTFSDRSVRPSYTAELTELAGRVSGLSSTPGTTADLDVRGSVNRSGALTILGKVNPLAKELFADVQVSLAGFELPPASPYTGKYAGYGISKGKLDLSLDYKIAGGKLDAKNKLVLDQFTFGDKVESPDAVNLPVRLAVALLKDRRGVIDIDLPIAGSLEDPEFKIWGAVLKVLGNLVVKAVTAPFSLIAGAFGGDDEVQKIEFTPGLAAFDATARKRLGVLTKALRERPGISFEIEGGADRAQDSDGLRRFLYERKLKAVKLTELVQGGAAVQSVDDLTIPATERDALLAKAYAGAKFPKPKNGLGLEKSVPPPEQEKLMLANTRVEDDELRDLALRRATAVQAALTKAAPETRARLFLVAPKVGSTGHRVELKLKD
jgi:hypothetical protein